MHDMCDLLTNLSCTVRQTVGANIVKNQPDVEALVVLLRDLPLNKAGFDAARGDRDWISMQICVLAVGPPGFSSVPYTSSKGKNKDEPGKRLYETDVLHNNTRFFPFHKGRTNKDRGDRVEMYKFNGEDDGEEPASGILEPGVCITNFMREESFASDSRFFVNRPEADSLPSGTLLFMQLGSQNIDQAAKGFLIKFKRAMLVHDHALVGPLLKNLPTSAVGFDDIMRACATQKALERQCYSGNAKIYTSTLRASGFAVHDPGTDRFVLAECDDEHGEIDVEESIVMNATGCVDIQTAVSVLNLAIATKSVNVLLSSSMQGDVIMNLNSESNPCKALCLAVDFDQMLSLQALKDTVSYAGPSSKQDIAISTLNNSPDSKPVTWLNNNIAITTPRGKRSIVFHLQDPQLFNTDSDAQTITRPVCQNAQGAYNALHIYMANTRIASKVDEQKSIIDNLHEYLRETTDYQLLKNRTQMPEQWQSLAHAISSLEAAYVCTLQVRNNVSSGSKRQRPDIRFEAPCAKQARLQQPCDMQAMTTNSFVDPQCHE